MRYYIHPSHEGHGDQENYPHVHVCFGGKEDKSSQVSVNLITCKALATGSKLRVSDQTEAENFVRDKQKVLMAEWESKSGNHW